MRDPSMRDLMSAWYGILNAMMILTLIINVTK